MEEITVEDLSAKLERRERVHLLDVREAEELAVCPFPGAEHIPMMDLFTEARRPRAGAGDAIVVVCHRGIRSYEAAAFLRMRGYANAVSLAGGVDAWAARVDPSMPRYG
jgi:rhodanese-related sulfurtransferase